MMEKLKFPLSCTKRDYTIHFNLEKGATAHDVLQSYYLGRLIDHHTQEAKARNNGQVNALISVQAIRRAEWEFQ